MTRTVDSTGLVWQEGPHGSKIVGEVHQTKYGRLNVVMVGRKITPKSLGSFEEARQVALDYEATGEDAALLARIIDPSAATS